MLTPAASRAAQRVILSSNSLSHAAVAPVRSLPCVIRQRRHSSSKPSSTPKQPATPPASTPKQSSSGTSKKRTPKSKAAKEGADAKRVASEAQQDNGVQPPSVPSTAHIDPKAVHVASLFAQHRPISLNQPIPPYENQKSFDAIFAPRSSKPKTQDVLFTLASAVKQLENAASGQADQDGNASSAVLNLEDLAKTFKPFQTPPPPVPVDSRYAAKHVSTPAVSFWIEEPPMPEGLAAEIIEESGRSNATQSPYRERRRARKAVFGRLLQQYREQLNTLSVKRQRRLKMKKHKFKKLLKRTRNLRRRQDRL